eukprot:CAMPEP_0194078700 /NCGR_PEP_ID=MMETSP0149-20130528/5031_1 /TAXON_ID=122233 /ORGANISM="Chaetoceros debilis, Strain MM31A-1" /LENGTH=56 /DNA_ID=CAMNT_0038760007 /DNA_START=128 /DNA_END=295 /DNA_ORIENTATION=+
MSMSMSEEEPPSSGEKRMQKTFLFRQRDSPSGGEAGIGDSTKKSKQLGTAPTVTRV